MSSEAWPEGVGRIALEEVGSTNAEALRRMEALRQPTWIVADRQSAGRGRRGRAWVGGEGNLTATLALPLSEPVDRIALRSFVAAIALFDALAASGATGLSLKWPNDVLLREAKVAGILLETAGRARGLRGVAIGFGVNVRSAPPPETLGPDAIRSTSLAEAGISVAPAVVLARLAAAFLRWEGIFAAEGFDPIRAAWLGRAARLGGQVRARTGAASVSGRFESLDRSGALILETAQGRRSISAADIFF